MQAFQGDHVWLEPDKPGDFAVAIGAKVIAVEFGQVQLEDDDGNEHYVDSSRVLRHMHVTSLEGVEDMIRLGDLNESGILRNLFIRYTRHHIYTYTGSILISVNPYQDLPIYTPEEIVRYKDKKIGELPPHIFAIADNAYSNMIRYLKDQCIIISGESGSGKSECTKLILQFLASVSGQHSPIEQQILAANPIIEAFGNAKTIRNNNSSRFGKYIDIHFNEKGVIEGAKIEHYLLEKSRIVSQRKGERNYHIFYCMLAGMSPERKAVLELQDAKAYDYLVMGKSIECDGRDDEKDFQKIQSAMKILTFSNEDIWEILKILTILLHLGNVRFNEFELDNIEASEIEDISSINRAAKLLEVEPQALIDALTTKTIIAKDESVTYTMNKVQAMDVRDAFVKWIYGRMFVWIVEKLNQAIYRPQQQQHQKSIRVLDIFSFENFDKNSFEQLCINYAIESLQQFFVSHIFKLEQAEYNLEGISWKNIEFVDNQGVLDLIADKPMNMLALIDEESKFPKGTDESMLNKLHFYHSINPNYVKPKAAINQTFGVKHFAGLVVYDCEGFLEKNRDTFSADLVQLIQASKSEFMNVLFNTDISMDTESRKKTLTLASQFKKSLELLMATLNSCQPFFVRCIKPNELKKAMLFDRELCCKQLRYSGMMETIRIRRAGYPIRHRFSEFVSRYRTLVKGLGPTPKEDSKAAVSKICAALLDSADFKLGRTKVFLKVAQDAFLEQQREKILAGRNELIQKFVVTWFYRKRFIKMRKGFTRLQAVFRCRKLAARFQLTFKWITQLQSCCRGYLLRQWIKKRRLAIEQIQAFVRTIVAMKMLKIQDLTKKHIEPHSSETHEDKKNSSPITQKSAPAPSHVEDGVSNAEVQKTRKTMSLEITLTNGSTETMAVNADTTAKTLCQQLSEKINLKDQFGFSLYISLQDSMTKVESDSIVLEAISNYEGLSKGQDVQDQETPWRLFFRKEIFTPWSEPSDDSIATNLIYHQIVSGIQKDEYSLDKDDDMAMIAAQQYFIEYEHNFDAKLLESLLPSYINESYLLKDNISTEWVASILTKLKGPYFHSPKINPLKIKEDIVTYSKFKWPLLFSQMFEVDKLSGPNLPKDDAVIAVNWTGVYVVDDLEQVLLELSFPEISNISHVRTTDTEAGHNQILTITTIKGDKYIITSNKAEELRSLVTNFLEGLKQRSNYAVAVRNLSSDSSENSSQLIIKKGDLIILEKAKNGNGLYFGSNVNSNKKGFFPPKSVHIIPTVTKPPIEILNILTQWARHQKDNEKPKENIAVLHNLEQFSKDFFRSPKDSKNKKHSKDLWRHSKDPIKHPLLMELKGQEELSAQACNCYVGIMKYMGDYPSKKTRLSSVFFTDQIFTSPLSNETLRDEVYCQIMRQLTDNKNSVSEERGWELMWLATGCFSPNDDLLKELISFLLTRVHISLAADSLNRLQKCINKGRRQFPPHLMEVEAVQQKTFQIFQKFHFPDGTDVSLEVDSSTGARELCHLIAKKLGLKSAEGFSLFLQIGEKRVSIPEGHFFFDFLRQMTSESSYKTKSHKKGLLPYVLFFMKKLWLETVPGEDLQADVIFYYNQALPSYLKGYHKCTKEEAAHLGALIYRTKYGENEIYFSNTSEILSELIPSDLLGEQSADQWKMDIMIEHKKDNGKSSNQSKTSFLDVMSQWSTFGSDFFEVKQTYDPSIPENLLIAINENGLHLLHQHSKELIMRYPFSKITSCRGEDTHFQFETMGTLDNEIQLKFLTAMGYKMEDLVASYIKLIV
ncbi:unnamed protein product [Lymnaea stagnalis]|uniref:Uncharacterized protein n=1 Tax=Lymnaea stagnalis TaxID=6523 RepID=A0AAV2I0Y5_LYMST